ncbi:MAG: insulinase family protein [Myxococcales bacterium]|nr:insulinase family protein [Myxococcales bacterium]
MLARTLPTGLKVVVDPSHSAKVVSAQVWVRVGSADELPEEAGLAHVHEHMLFKGTKRRKVGEIAAEIEGAGGDINAYTSFDETVYHVNIASQEVDVALDVLSDAVLNSAFDADELTRELEVVLEELRRGKDQPARMTSELLFSQVFSKHTYGRPIIGYQEVVEQFSREGILAFYRKWYQPQNMLLVVAGDVDPEAIFTKAEELFPGQEERLIPPRPRQVEPPQTEPRFAETRMDISETHVGLAWHGPALRDEDTPPVDVLSVLLGTGESSRLYRRVRREKELVTDAYAYAYTPQDPGLIGCGAQAQGQLSHDVIEALLTEVLRLRFEPPTEAEVEKAKTIVLSEAIYSSQTVQGRARRLGYFEMVGEGLEFEKKYREGISAVTPADVLRVAQKWLIPEHVSVVLVRPKADQEEFNTSKIGPIIQRVQKQLAAEYAIPHIEPLSAGIVRTQLSNGAKLVIQPDHSVPLISIVAATKGGQLAEDPSRAGVSHLVSELLVRGTKRYSAEQITDTCDAMAGGVIGQSGRNSLGLRGEFLKDSWSLGLDIFLSCLLEPAFETTEFERERRSVLEDIASRQDSPGAVAFDAFSRALYKDHPYGWTGLGTTESVKSLTESAVQEAYNTQLAPERLTFSVVGDVVVPDLVAQLERTVGKLGADRASPSLAMVLPHERIEEVHSEEIFRDKAQAQLVFGFRGLTIYDSRRFALELLSQVLGGQSGRLFLELRDRQSLAYSVGCFNLEGLAPGYLALHIGTHPSKVEIAEAGMRRELERLVQEPVSSAELQRAQRYLVGSYELALQRASSRANTIALNEAYGLGYDEHLRHGEQLMAVTPKDIQSVAGELVDFSRMVRVLVKPDPSITNEEQSS